MTTVSEAPAAARTRTRGVAKLLSLRTAAPETVVPQQGRVRDVLPGQVPGRGEGRGDLPRLRGATRHMAWDPRTAYADGYPPIKAADGRLGGRTSWR